MEPPNLANLVKRLEVATTRLEELSGMSSSGFSSKETGELVAERLKSVNSASLSPAKSRIIPPVVIAYKNLVITFLGPFLEKSKVIGGLVLEQSKAVESGFLAQMEFLDVTCKCCKPEPTSSNVFSELLKPTQRALEKVCEFKEMNRPSNFFNHLSTVSEGISALGWVALEIPPAPYVGEMKDAAQFYANRVIKEWKDKDRGHVDWANSYIELLVELQNYIKEYYAGGLNWNPKGIDPSTKLEELGRTPPIPPPPTPISSLQTTASFSKTTKGKADMAAVFADLNRGESVTAGLKKVSASPKAGRGAGLGVGAAPLSSEKPSCPASAVKQAGKPVAKTFLDGNRWTVENYEGENVEVVPTEIKQSVYIYRCMNTTVRVKGKVNTITVDTCQKTGVVVQSALSTVDVVNSKSVQLQITGKTPTIAIDRTDGALVYLNKDCLDVDVLTAKSSEVNVAFPPPDSPNDAEYMEKAVPEQFKSSIVNGMLVTHPVEHSA